LGIDASRAFWTALASGNRDRPRELRELLPALRVDRRFLVLDR